MDREYSSDIAFTPAVKAQQQRRGSRMAYATMEQDGSWETRITPPLKTFIEAQRSVFLATASADGQPYIQHRGGPPGFLRVLDEKTLAFADFVGNRQYISAGNLSENPKAQLFLIDYEQRRRIKVWGKARMIEDDAELLRRLMPEGYRARPMQVLLFDVEAWDSNCPQHIPRRYEADQVDAALAAKDAQIAALKARLQKLGGDGAAEN
jgi:predicted pyridoxine 5'-phosphate oxidase superfamily flavin-nucleotide-binding protein